jgi:metal-sulfur cluster biosynthetic enzyme
MTEPPSEVELRSAIDEHLAGVVDPAAGLDVLRMRLVRDLTIADGGAVSFTFRPSSPFCPMAFTLAPAIREAIASVPGVSAVQVRVENYDRAEELERILEEGGPD